jgi:hypothetical protein
MGVLPSLNTRSNRYENNYMTSCDEIPTKIPKIEGRDYDPCLKPEFSALHTNINGMFVLARLDTNAHILNYSHQRFWSKYRTNHIDSRHAVGVPEIILHPHANRYDNTSPLNYKHILEIEPEHNYNVVYGRAWETINDMLKKGSMTIDLFTKLYVNYNSVSDEVKARCVPIEEPYKLHYLNSSFWGGNRNRRFRTRKNRLRR